MQMVGNSGGSVASCLQTAAQNSTLHMVNFNATGSTDECGNGFRLTWDGNPSQGPYNFSVIPLDGGYKPWVMPLKAGTYYYDWQVNMTQGTYFTIMFK